VCGDLVVDPGRHEATIGGRPVGLSALELRLLATLLDADGRALTRDQLHDGIHGTGEGDVLDRAIDVYIKRLREKLGDDANEPRYVATVRGVGYRAAGHVERRRPDGARSPR
jgi:DNA-binding response OmpR family regulator